MKISPMSSTVMPTIDSSGNPQPSAVEKMRTLKMSTNANPFLDASNSQKLPILDPNSQTKPAVEVNKQPISPQLALIARQRRALQVKERELANREKAHQQRSTGNSVIDTARLKSEPLSVLLENGVTYDQLTQAIIARQGNTEVDTLKAKIESLQQNIDQKFADKDAQAEKEVLAEMQREASRLATNSDDYEFVRETRSVPHVIDLIRRTYKQSGEVLDVRDAMALVEAELLKDYQRAISFKKMQGLISPPVTQQPQQRPQGMRTLTNRDTASVPMSRYARAIAAFNGTYKR